MIKSVVVRAGAGAVNFSSLLSSALGPYETCGPSFVLFEMALDVSKKPIVQREKALTDLPNLSCVQGYRGKQHSLLARKNAKDIFRNSSRP